MVRTHHTFCINHACINDTINITIVHIRRMHLLTLPYLRLRVCRERVPSEWTIWTSAYRSNTHTHRETFGITTYLPATAFITSTPHPMSTLVCLLPHHVCVVYIVEV